MNKLICKAALVLLVIIITNMAVTHYKTWALLVLFTSAAALMSLSLRKMAHPNAGPMWANGEATFLTTGCLALLDGVLLRLM